MRTISRPRPPPYWASSAGLTDILSAFTVHFDIKISTSELRGADTRGIRLCWVLLRVQGTIKMLGVTFGICGTPTTQVSTANFRLARTCATMWFAKEA